MEDGPPVWLTIVAAGVAAYGAVLSTLLAAYQVRRDRRRLRIIAGTLIALGSGEEGEPPIYEVLEVRAVNEGHRPVDVRQAGVVTEDGTVLHPGQVRVPGIERLAPRLIADGEVVAFHFDVRSFDDGYLPNAVWVQDQGDRRYTKRFGRKQRRLLLDLFMKAKARDEREGAANDREP